MSHIPTDRYLLAKIQQQAERVVQSTAVPAVPAVLPVILRDLRTDYWPKPVPDRRYDWSARFDELAEDSPVGHGTTRLEAIEALLLTCAARGWRTEIEAKEFWTVGDRYGHAPREGLLRQFQREQQVQNSILSAQLNLIRSGMDLDRRRAWAKLPWWRRILAHCRRGVLQVRRWLVRWGLL